MLVSSFLLQVSSRFPINRIFFYSIQSIIRSMLEGQGISADIFKRAPKIKIMWRLLIKFVLTSKGEKFILLVWIHWLIYRLILGFESIYFRQSWFTLCRFCVRVYVGYRISNNQYFITSFVHLYRMLVWFFVQSNRNTGFSLQKWFSSRWLTASFCFFCLQNLLWVLNSQGHVSLPQTFELFLSVSICLISVHILLKTSLLFTYYVHSNVSIRR